MSGRTLRLILYHQAGTNGIRTAQLANFRILAYRLNDANPSLRWLLLQFVSYVNDCGQSPRVSVSAPYEQYETESPAVAIVRLNGPFLFPISVDYNTNSSTATPGEDYLPVSGTIAFAPGETYYTIPIPILDDNWAEGNERFNISLSNVVSATTENSSFEITIRDNEPLPSYIWLASTNLQVVENDGSIPITVLQDGFYTGTVQVDFVSGDGTAVAGNDYTVISTTLTFAPGVLTQTVHIPILDDSMYETTETFIIRLNNPRNGVISTGNGIGTVSILNDDAPPELSLAGTFITVGEAVSSGLVSVTVQLYPASGVTATVVYSTTDYMATAGSDYLPVQGNITFTPGITQTVIPIPILNDTIAEPNEWFLFHLSNPVNSVIYGTNPLGVIIMDDECLYNMYPVPTPYAIQVENFTCGGEGVAYHDETLGNYGDSNYRAGEAVDISLWQANNYHYVTHTEDGEWLIYTIDVLVAGRYDLVIRAYTEVGNSCFRVEIDGVDVSGQVEVPIEGAVFYTVEVAERLTLTAGPHQIRLSIPCGGADFDYLYFIPSPPDKLFLPVMLRP